MINTIQNNTIQQLAQINSENTVTETQKKTQSDQIQQSVKTTQNSNSPTLPLGEPAAMTAFLTGNTAMPSLGATMLALIQECSSEQRRAAADQRAVQTELSVGILEKQAGEMRAKAVTALVTGVISGALSIGAGIASTTMGSMTLKDALVPNANQAAIMAKNNLTQGVSGIFSSTGQLVNTIGQGVVGLKDADIKQLDAQIERIRASTDTLKMLEDSLKELIQKTQSSMDAIQANMNQTRTKILG